MVDLVRRVSASPLSIFGALAAAGIESESAVLAASTVTGLPPAPRLLLRNPVTPSDIDSIGIRDAGAVPLGQVQGRVWVAFSDPEAARAAIFSDDVVVCLALDAELRLARSHFETAFPAADAADTQAIAAISPAQIEAWRKQQQAAAPVPAPTPARFPRSATPMATKAPPPTVPAPRAWASMPTIAEADDSSEDDDDDGPLFDDPAPATVTTARPAIPTAPRNPQSEVNVTAEDGAIANARKPEHLRLLRAAQLGRLKRFQFERVIGSGGMATVYLAHDREHPGVPLAVKLLEPQLLDDPLAVGRFKREVRTLMGLKHPHVVAPVDGDAEADGGVLWLACRYLDGGTLADLMKRTGPLPASAAIPIVVALLEGQRHAHQAGVIHRDLKPHNVLLGTDGSLCIADFGVARAVGDEPLTRAGVRFGTPAYMAPEQALGTDTDARADLFSTGVMLYELLSGENPFVRGTPADTMRAVVAADVPALPPVLQVPAPVVRLLSALLSRMKDARPPDAESALQVLRPLASQLAPVGDVVRALLRDPAAYRGAAPVVDPESTVAEDADAIPPSVVDDGHSAFGNEPGALATRELPRVSLDAINAAARRALDDARAAADDLTNDATADGAPTLSQARPASLDVTAPEGQLAARDAWHDTHPPGDDQADNDNDDADDDAMVRAFSRSQRRQRVAVLLVLGAIVVACALTMWWATRPDG